MVIMSVGLYITEFGKSSIKITLGLLIHNNEGYFDWDKNSSTCVVCPTT